MAVVINGNNGISYDDTGIQYYGTDDDLAIRFDGTDAIINETGSGDLKLQSGGTTKLTIGSGVSLNADLSTNGNNINFGDNESAQFGDNNDLQIYHSGSHSYIDDAGTGRLYIRGGSDLTIGKYTGETHIYCVSDGEVQLFHNDSKKLETTSTGVDVTGTVTADQYDNDEALPTIRPSLLLDFANSKTLDPRITFTRASTATYYDGKTTVKAEENLFKYSQEFDQSAYWAATSYGTITSNQTTAPDGTTTAELYTTGTSTGQHTVFQDVTRLSTNSTYTLSVYVKNNGADYVYLSYRASSSSYAVVEFNISTGAYSRTGVANWTVDNYSITDVGNSWYRLTMTFSTDGSSFSSQSQRIGVGDGSTTIASGYQNITANGTDGFYIWGAQLERRSSATAYTPTTSQPITNYIPKLMTASAGVARFDHDPVTRESKGLLIEEQRTNLLTYSSQIDGSLSEYASVRTTQLQNQIIAPDGTLTGDKLIATTDNNTHRIDQQPRTMFSTSTTYTLSCYAKAGEYEGITLSIIGSSNLGNGVYFNLTTGSSGVIGGSYSSTMTDVGNGWYRCSVTRTTSSSINSLENKWFIGIVNSGSSISFAGNGYSGVYVWGAQVEAMPSDIGINGYATSYIETSGSSATRSMEKAKISGSDLDWFEDNNGTFYADIVGDKQAGNLRVMSMNNESNNNRIFDVYSAGSAGNDLNIYGNYGTTQTLSVTISSSVPNGTNYKFAFNLKVNDLRTSYNGGSITTDSDCFFDKAYEFKIGWWSDPKGIQHIKKIAYYPERLTDAQLQALTES